MGAGSRELGIRPGRDTSVMTGAVAVRKPAMAARSEDVDADLAMVLDFVGSYVKGKGASVNNCQRYPS